MADVSANESSRNQCKFFTICIAAVAILFFASSFSHAQSQMATQGSFNVSPSGAANYTIPLQISPGTGGMQPNLALGYNSQGSNGSLGIGWTLAGLSVIHRCNQTIVHDGAPGGISHDANDRFCLDGQRLIVVNGLANGADGAEYRTERESFNRIKSFGACGSGPCWWQIESKSGQIMQYGATVDSALEPAGIPAGGLVMVWALNKVSDRVGNYITLTYSEDNPNGEMHPTRIDYTGNANVAPPVSPYNSVVLEYEARTDVLGSEYIAGAPTKVSKRLKTIRANTNNGATEVRRYELTYDAVQPTSLLKSVRECVGVTCLPPTSFDWQLSTGTTQWAPTTTNWGSNAGNFKNSIADFNGDGIKDLLTVEKYTFGLSQIGYRTWVSYSTGTSFTAPVQLGTNPDIIVGDVNGDGRADVITSSSIYYSNGPGFNAPVASGVSIFTGTSTVTMFSGDVNGDSKDDLVYSQRTCNLQQVCSSNTYWALSNGAGFVGLTLLNAGFASAIGDVDGDGRADLLFGGSIRKWNGSGFDPGVVWTTSGLLGDRKLVDTNGDGRADLLLDSTTCQLYGNCNTTHNLAISNGASFATPAALGSELCGLGSCVFGDVTGDGVPDLVRVGGFSVSVRPMLRATPNFLTRVTDGLGAITEVTYKPISDTTVYTPSTGAAFPVRDIVSQAAINVVSQSKTSDGIGGLYTLRYSYAGAKVQLQGGGLLGFSSMRTDDDQKGTYSLSIFRQDWPYHGLPTEIYQRRSNGATLSATINTWSASNTYLRVYYPYVSRTVASSYELNQALISQITTNTTVDSYGNTTRVEILSSDGFSKVNVNNYTDNVSAWILGRVTCSAVTNTLPSAVSATRTSSFRYRTDGLLDREVVEPGTTCAGAPGASTDARLRVITDYAYDAFGNKQSALTSSAVASTDPAYFAPRTSYTYFDTSGTCTRPSSYPAGRFPVRSVNALNQSECYEYDPKYGGQTKLTGPNGLATQWTYDEFGRKKTEIRADTTMTTLNYVYDSSWPIGAYYIQSITTGAPQTRAIYDKLNRQVRSYVTHFTNTKSIGSGVDFNNLGQVLYQYRNYLTDASSTPATTFTYDALGRVFTVSAPNGLVTTYTYNGFTTSVTVNNSTGNQTTSKTVNSQGWTTSTTDAASKVTNFAYDPNGNLLTTTDPKGNKVTMTYDLKGRKTGMNDPDTGAWIYTYDALGQLKSQRDAKLQTTTMQYDLLGRMTNRSEPSLISTWTYDKYADNSACNKGIGKLCEVNSNNTYRRKHYYDNLGRANRTDYYHDSTTSFYQVDNSFDSAGRVDTVTYPSVTIGTTTSRLIIKNNYNAAGYLASIAKSDGTVTYWTGTSMNADGQITGETLGNGISTIRTFEATTGRLLTINSGASGSVQNLTYGYDRLGNLTSRSDTFTTPSAATINESFTYDSLNRLKTVAMTGTTTLNKSYNYDEIGNIIYKSDLGGTGVLTYPASGATSVRPHAVTNVNGTIGSIVNPDYNYDANGNMLNAFAGTRTFTYASFNLPTRSIRNGNYIDWIYDTDHNRTQELTNTPVTGQPTQIIYVNPGNQPFFEKHINITGTGLTEYRHFIAGVAILTKKSNVTEDTKYLFKDRLGSVNVVAMAGVLERYSYDAFGKTRNLNGSDVTTSTMPTPSIRRGFTGHEMLSEFNGGFIHMNGRIYDPNLGRFMQADPQIQFPAFSQSYNRYSYGFNNPLGGTDPSGYSWFGDALSDLGHALDDFHHNPFKIENVFGLNHAMPGHGTVDRFMMTHEWARMVGRAVVSFVAGYFGGPWAAAGANAVITGYEVWLSGGRGMDIHKAASISFATSMAFNFVGDGASAIAGTGNQAGAVAFKIVGHAAVGCASASASGGDCEQGALSAGFGAATSVATARLGLTGPAHFVVTVVAGGVGAELGGGKFVNGASTAAMGYLMNWMLHGGFGIKIPFIGGLDVSVGISHLDGKWDFGLIETSDVPGLTFGKYMYRFGFQGALESGDFMSNAGTQSVQGESGFGAFALMVQQDMKGNLSGGGFRLGTAAGVSASAQQTRLLFSFQNNIVPVYRAVRDWLTK